MEQITTKSILDRSLDRSTKGYTEEYLEVYKELSQEYFCKVPKIKDVYDIFMQFEGNVIETNPKVYLKLNSLLEILMNLEIKNK